MKVNKCYDCEQYNGPVPYDYAKAYNQTFKCKKTGKEVNGNEDACNRFKQMSALRKFLKDPYDERKIALVFIVLLILICGGSILWNFLTGVY